MREKDYEEIRYRKNSGNSCCRNSFGAGVFLGIDALSDDFNVVFTPDTAPVQTLPDNEQGTTPQPKPEPETGELTQLASPEIEYDQETNILSWNEIENASGYLVIAGDREYRTQETQVELNIEEDSQYTITIKALGDGENYKDSEVVSLNGFRQELNKMYYEQIEDNIKSAIENKKIALQVFNIIDIVNIDIKDDEIMVTTISNSQLSTEPAYRIFNIKLNENCTVSTLEDLAKIVKNIGDTEVNINKTYFSVYDFEDDCYNKLIQDSLLNGELKYHIDNGYETFKIYSFVSNGNSPQSFIVNSCIKLQKGNDIKVVTLQNKVTQKYNGSYAFGGYVNAYINGTAEDVKIEETSFTEASPVSSVWQAANDKYNNQQ